MIDLHKFLVAVSWIEADHRGNGGTAPVAMIWDKGSILRSRSSSFRVIIEHASLPGPPGFQDISWCSLSSSLITKEDVAVWPHSVNILLEFMTFWPLFIDLRVLQILVKLVFRILNYSSCLNKALDTDCFVEKSYSAPPPLLVLLPSSLLPVVVIMNLDKVPVYSRVIPFPRPPPWWPHQVYSLPATSPLYQAHASGLGTVWARSFFQAPGGHPGTSGFFRVPWWSCIAPPGQSSISPGWFLRLFLACCLPPPPPK